MKTREKIVIGIIILILISVLLVAVYQSPVKDKLENECSIVGDYCVYSISQQVMYASPDSEVVETPLSWEEAQKIIDKNNTGCQENPLFYYVPSEEERTMEGLGYERSAIICGSRYYIYDFSSSFGPKVYGPYYFYV